MDLYYSSVAKGQKIETRSEKVLRLILTFEEVTEEKLARRGEFFPSPPTHSL